MGVEKRRRKTYLAGVLVRGLEAEDGLQSRGSLINGSSDQNLKPTSNNKEGNRFR